MIQNDPPIYDLKKKSLFWRECITCVKSLQSCPTLCDSVDCSPSGSSSHGILQARILEWVAISSSRGSSWPRYSGLMCKHMHFSPSSSSHLLDKFYANFRLLWNSDMICVRDSISVSDLQHFHSQYCFPFCSKSRMWLEHNFLQLHPGTCLPPPTKSLLLWEWKWILPVCICQHLIHIQTTIVSY